MADKVHGLDLWFHVQLDSSPWYLVVDYTPIARAGDGPEYTLSDYRTQFQTGFANLPESLQAKLQRLAQFATASVDVPQIDLGDLTARAPVSPVYFQVVLRDGRRAIDFTYKVGGGLSSKRLGLTEAAQRLVDNVLPTIKQLAWDHLRTRLNAPPTRPHERRTVFISYRKGDARRQAFVEAVAHRLGREGFLPWFDAWEISAGDSIVREIDAGLTNACAILAILTADYPGGRWAREELETAISQRVERQIKILPILYEPCSRPALLQALRYVDCTSHEAGEFETQFAEVVDALNDVELNPYRR